MGVQVMDSIPAKPAPRGVVVTPTTSSSHQLVNGNRDACPKRRADLAVFFGIFRPLRLGDVQRAPPTITQARGAPSGRRSRLDRWLPSAPFAVTCASSRRRAARTESASGAPELPGA